LTKRNTTIVALCQGLSLTVAHYRFFECSTKAAAHTVVRHIYVAWRVDIEHWTTVRAHLRSILPLTADASICAGTATVVDINATFVVSPMMQINLDSRAGSD
jgi:hypothetical protein